MEVTATATFGLLVWIVLWALGVSGFDALLIGAVLFLISVTVLFLRSAGSMEYYTLPLAVLTMADAAAALIGTEYGRRHFGAGDRIKSVEGTVTFFVTTWIVSVTILILGTPVPRSNVIWLSTVIAAMAALIEADSWEGFDNVFIPLGVHSLMVTWGQSEPWLLGAISALWLGVLIETRRIAAPLRLTPHALRVTFIALFLSAGIVEPPNIVLPALAVVAHLAMRRFSDRGVAISDLDFVLVLVLLGIVWLAAGASSYHDATEFYTMTFAALAAGYAVLAVPSRRFHLRIATGIVASAIVLPAHQFLGEGMADGVRWMPRPVAITACAVTTAACVFVAVWNPPVLLRKSPGFKLAALAWALPAATFGVLLFR